MLGLWRGTVDAAAGGDGIRRQIVAAVPELLSSANVSRAELRGIGVGFGGPVDDATRSVIKSHQIAGWDGFPLADWLGEAWGGLRAWAEADLREPQSAIRTKLASAIADLGGRLGADEAMQAWVNEQALAAARPLCEEHREGIGRFIAAQVKAWDEDYMVRQFELNIGADLQYIRINGTLIGGLAGVLIHAATQVLRG